jgi:hypothetical protein
MAIALGPVADALAAGAAGAWSPPRRVCPCACQRHTAAGVNPCAVLLTGCRCHFVQPQRRTRPVASRASSTTPSHRPADGRHT